MHLTSASVSYVYKKMHSIIRGFDSAVGLTTTQNEFKDIIATVWIPLNLMIRMVGLHSHDYSRRLIVLTFHLFNKVSGM